MTAVHKPASGDDWLAVTEDVLPIADAYEWAVLPQCGGVVLFSGTVREHAEGRPGVTSLEYEAYAERVPALLPRVGSSLGGQAFRWSLYRKNQEYQAGAGFLVGLLYLLWIAR